MRYFKEIMTLRIYLHKVMKEISRVHRQKKPVALKNSNGGPIIDKNKIPSTWKSYVKQLFGDERLNLKD